MRIKFLAPLIPILALLCVAATADAPAPFTLHDLGNGAWAAIDNPDAKAARAGANAGFVISNDGVAVVDTFEHAPAAQELLNQIRAKTNLPIRFVVNTHYHLDHVAGNSIFAAAGATVMAQENVRAWERTENLKFFGAKITPEQKEMVESLGLPSVTYKDGVEIYLGAHKLIVRSLPGHTGGDSVVYDPAANVVFCGDLFWDHTLPNLIDASTKPWIKSLDTLIADYPTATFVPGHGEVGHVQDVRDFRGYLTDLRDFIAQAQAQGKSGDELMNAVLPQIQQKYGSWNFFGFAKTDIQLTDQELRGQKRIPQPPSQ
ncbi:MAG TPA: MBL fold metallo-hydrolase [Candidatus Acidoferrales bacterium]|nr:MBL fold metallo-hydrolase [Candidatus Acidoferrales bacterium]